MYVPVTLGQPPAALAPIEIASAGPLSGQRPARTILQVQGSRLNVLAGHRVNITGRLLEAPRLAMPAKLVALQERRRGRWTTLASARTGTSGRFKIDYVPRQLGSSVVRLRFAGDARDAGSHRRLGRLNVFRMADASWYGGGGGLACGGALSSSTLGVANKTLPCGTLVTLRYNGRSIRVPVVDRGPYVAGRDFDLTEATKQALGFGDTGQVWSTG